MPVVHDLRLSVSLTINFSSAQISCFFLARLDKAKADVAVFDFFSVSISHRIYVLAVWRMRQQQEYQVNMYDIMELKY